MNTIANLPARPLSPGVGFINFDRAHDDVRTKKEAKLENKPQVKLYKGALMLPQLGRVAVFAKGIDREDRYEFVIKKPLDQEDTETEGQPWPVLSTFALPYFNGASYVEGNMTIGTRTYQVRMIRNEESGWVQLRLPQVIRSFKSVAEFG